MLKKLKINLFLVHVVLSAMGVATNAISLAQVARFVNGRRLRVNTNAAICMRTWAFVVGMIFLVNISL